MHEKDFWRVEQACRDAWPAVREEMLHGWLMRMSKGETRRTSSVNQTPSTASLEHVLPAAETFYRRFERPLLFRTLSFEPRFEEQLGARDFMPSDPTSTLWASLEAAPNPVAHQVELNLVPSPDWIADKLRLSPMSQTQEKAYRFMLKSLKVPAAFVRIVEEGQGVSVAYGAISNGLLVIESVVTDVNRRGHRLAEATVGSLMAWGAGSGAAASCLQVVSDNAPAVALYSRLGYEKELYRYRYWQAVS